MTKTAEDFANVKELRKSIKNANAETVDRLLEEEKAGKNRTTYVAALEDRKAKLDEKAAAKPAPQPAAADKPKRAPVATPPGHRKEAAPVAGDGYTGTHDERVAASTGGSEDASTDTVASGESVTGAKHLRKPVNKDELAALQAPPDRRVEVDLTSSANPQRAAQEKAAARADTAKEGPIAGTGAHRIAAPAPAEVPGAPAEMSDPQRHDARRIEVAPIAPPAPTSGPEVERPARKGR